jgi:protein arginine kinase activator
MLCQNCGKNHAAFHYKTSVNGVVSELHLCAECASKINNGGPVNFNIIDPNSGSYLSSVMSDFMGSTEQTQAGRCPLCGSTARDISRTGKAGCAKCYDTFSDMLLHMIKRIHGNTKHNGKYPASAGIELQQKRKTEKLKQELSRAVEAQDYEHAAELRDRIRELENLRQETGGQPV